MKKEEKISLFVVLPIGIVGIAILIFALTRDNDRKSLSESSTAGDHPSVKLSEPAQAAIAESNEVVEMAQSPPKSPQVPTSPSQPAESNLPRPASVQAIETPSDVTYVIGYFDELKSIDKNKNGKLDAEESDHNREDDAPRSGTTEIALDYIGYFLRGVDTYNLSSTMGEPLWVIRKGETVAFSSQRALDVFHQHTKEMSWKEKPIVGKSYILKEGFQFEEVTAE